MDAASQTESWLYENLSRIEQCVAEYEQETGKKPFVVLMEASTSQIVGIDVAALEAVPLNLRNHPALAEVIDRHMTGAYIGEDGKQFDVPIICKAASVYRTSLETFKMKRELMALGATIITRASIGGTKGVGGSLPKQCFKQHKRRH